jgi:hypothetical protein
MVRCVVNDPLFNEKETAAEFFDGKVPVRTLQFWRLNQRGPKWLKLGRRVYYRKSDLESFVAGGVVDPEASR